MYQTENGAISHGTTGSGVLDLFFKTVRTCDESTVGALMTNAWNENPLLTLKAIFHLRDCRGGKGERARFYDCMRWLIANGHSSHVLKNLEHIPFYGTWKDLITLFMDTELESAALDFFAKSLHEDITRLNTAIKSGNVNADGHANITISLAGKWAPTEGGSADRKYKLARKLTVRLRARGIKNIKDYRTKVLVPLRSHLNIVERDMCSGGWKDIDFSHVPSVAMKNYRKAFIKHEEIRFKKYLDDVKNGVTKINASQVFPHTLVHHYMSGGKYDETIELQWKEIVRAAKEKFGNTSAMSIVDVSGSMAGEPMEVAIALGLLLSEITCEQFRGSIITFTETPSLFRIDTEDSLQDKVKAIRSAPWGMSTDLSKVFNLLLDTAKILRVPAENMPKTLYIFSDMQFNTACPTNTKTNFEHIEFKYRAAKYNRPNIVFWNLRGNTVDFPVEHHVPNTALVSGFSPSLMELFMSGDVVSPYAVMLKALSAPRYSKIMLDDGSEYTLTPTSPRNLFNHAT